MGYGLGGALAVAPVVWLALSPRLAWTWSRKQVVVFIGVCALAFVFFYPVWTGIGLDPADYLRRMWLRSWI